ncbi:MAG TPA: HAD hydrolase-like protein [Usitatibacter sp.]
MRAFLFDLDGTLTDPREGITRSIAYALDRLGVESPPLDDLVFAIGPPLRASLAQLLGTDARDTVEAALAFYRERFAEIGLFENRPYEGIAEALESIAASGALLVVATSKPRIYARRIVDHFALGAHFSEVHGCELDGTREDKRDLIAHILPHHGIGARDAVMVGDRGIDMRAARHHGLAAVGALWGYGTREELAAHGAQRFCAEPCQLGKVLADLATY